MIYFTLFQCSVMLDLLPSIPECINVDGKKCNLIWKGQLAVLLLYKEQKINFSGLSETFTDVVIKFLLLKNEISPLKVSNEQFIPLVNFYSNTNLDQPHKLSNGWKFSVDDDFLRGSLEPDFDLQRKIRSERTHSYRRLDWSLLFRMSENYVRKFDPGSCRRFSKMWSTHENRNKYRFALHVFWVNELLWINK